MPETPSYSLPFPTPADPSNAPAQFQALAEAVDDALTELAQGAFGSITVNTNATVGGALEVTGDTTLSGDLLVGDSLVTGVWTSYDPNWTTSTGDAPFVGDGSLEGRYMLLGKTVFFEIIFTMGSTTTYGNGGFWQFALPFACFWGFTAAASYRDVSGSINRCGSVDCRPGETATAVTRCNVPTGSAVNNTTPFTWASSDTFKVAGVYEMV